MEQLLTLYEKYTDIMERNTRGGKVISLYYFHIPIIIYFQISFQIGYYTVAFVGLGFAFWRVRPVSIRL